MEKVQYFQSITRIRISVYNAVSKVVFPFDADHDRLELGP